MAKTAQVTKQLEIAGYTDIAFEPIDADVLIGRNLDEAVALHLELDPAGEIFREAGEEAESRHDEIVEALKARLAPYLGPAGLMVRSGSWKVTARSGR
jgi:hypothetical protein